jgi:cobalt/nickel transport protein
MKHAARLVAALVVGGLVASAAPAHFNMLLPEKPSAKKDEAVTLVYQWGHPFEHQLFDAPAPEKLEVVFPDGQSVNLINRLEKITVPAGDKKVTAYRLNYTPTQRGDYVFVLRTPAIWMEEEQEFWEDTVKVVLHVQAQKGWDGMATRTSLQWEPLTRPYGLQAGMAFQGLVHVRGGAEDKGLAGALVEIERYNPTPPAEKDLPPDEQITRTAKTDPNGVVTATLPDPGWWSLTAARDAGKRNRDGKQYPVRERTTLWVFVDEKPAPAGK